MPDQNVLVVARFRENTTWARAMAREVLEYTKKIGNIGRVSGVQRSGALVRPRDFSDDVYEPILGSGRRWKFNSCGGPNDCLPCLFGVTRSIGVALPTESSMGAFFSSTLQALLRVLIEVWWFLYNMHYTQLRTARVGCRTSWSGSGSPSCEASFASESCQAKIPYSRLSLYCVVQLHLHAQAPVTHFAF